MGHELTMSSPGSSSVLLIFKFLTHMVTRGHGSDFPRRQRSVGGLVCAMLSAAVGRRSVNSRGMYSMTVSTDRPAEALWSSPGSRRSRRRLTSWQRHCRRKLKRHSRRPPPPDRIVRPPFFIECLSRHHNN